MTFKDQIKCLKTKTRRKKIVIKNKIQRFKRLRTKQTSTTSTIDNRNLISDCDFNLFFMCFIFLVIAKFIKVVDFTL